MKVNDIRLEDLGNISIEKVGQINSFKKSKLNRFGIHSVLDLIFHFPKSYKDRTKLSLIKEVQDKEDAFIVAKILEKHVIETKKQIEIHVRDHSGRLIIKFFNNSSFIRKIFKRNTYVQIYGRVYLRKNKKFMIHPEYKILSSLKDLTISDSLTPIYPNIDGISQNTIHTMIRKCMVLFNQCVVKELIPKPFNTKFIGFKKAIKIIHQPNSRVSTIDLKKYQHPAQKRLIFEELLAFQLSFMKIRKKNNSLKAIPLIVKESTKRKIIRSLPYSLTDSQKNAIREIELDLSKSTPMMRLLCGDVGTGKTIVALFSSLCAISNGKQVALMTPTAILAKQHADFFKRMFHPIGKKVIQLSKSNDKKYYLSQLDQIKSGEVSMIVGTHSIFQKKIDFCSLSLVIIDEQHRFGVDQRSKLLRKGRTQDGIYAHQLIMTATPIPRTLSMKIHANLDVSFINEYPFEKKVPAKTVIISNLRRDELIQRIKKYSKKNKTKIYWICTIVNSSNNLNVVSLMDINRKLKVSFSTMQIGLIHGKMSVKDKKKIISDFRKNRIQILVATTIVEVGIDIPDVNIIVIENPERLGLSQLHQLRGRIGRNGDQESFCILLYPPLITKVAQSRLRVFKNSFDGFQISEKDLLMRGPGENLGVKQTGYPIFRIADLKRDFQVLYQVRNLAERIIFSREDNSEQIMKRWIFHKTDTNSQKNK
ncbi:ATP-dependent DNA helicase RecG [Candidatus Riesia pediculischaeffi]|uniref:Probable DNA 3'-5' helicase RecG n=1 Tax=Candidatus Riesia pediculischaeffi PTSU TaxID=1401651 RepID=A0A0C1S9I2_9ENTR|nr:ATP-dependent DNA helicase RecG [Candidatus Riesia pediculischaeffi]KIE63931.1 ATP-dependent DNA helicase RecG [Candidatus Riesia pediculischaeffi PTSU]